MPLILDGRRARESIRARLEKEYAKRHAVLAIVQVGDDEASNTYIAQKKLFGARVGARVIHKRFTADITERALLREIATLNTDVSIAGIIVQLPLPMHLDKRTIQNAVMREKDVDGLADGSVFTPATARGVLELIVFYRISIMGKKVVVFGRGRVAGAPIARLLEEVGARVSVVHSQTPAEEAKHIARSADIVVSAVGSQNFLGPDYFRQDRTQVVVDVGGDVDFEKVSPLVAAISPVPGGVGPMTVAGLFENLFDAIMRK